MAGQTPRGNGTRAPASFSHPQAPALPAAGFDEWLARQVRELSADPAGEPATPRAGWSDGECAAYLQRYTLGGAGGPGRLPSHGRTQAISCPPVATGAVEASAAAPDAASAELHRLACELRLLAGLCAAAPGARVQTTAATLAEHLHDLAERAQATSARIDALPRHALGVAQHDAASLHASRLAAALRTMADATGPQPAGCVDLSAEDLATTLAGLGDRAQLCLAALDGLAATHRGAVHGQEAA